MTCLSKADFRTHQFTTSTRKLALECKIDRRTMRDYLDYLETAHFIGRLTAHQSTTITIIYYNDLQNFLDGEPPKNAPTLPPKVGESTTQSGRIQHPKWVNSTPTLINEKKEVNNNKANVHSSNDLKAKDLTAEQLEDFRKVPFSDRFLNEVCLRGMGMIDNEVGKAIERIYPQETGYKGS